MNSNFLSLFIPFLAGISTIIGYFPTYISSIYQDRVIGFSLSLSAGVMFFVSCFSLIPEAIVSFSSTLSFLSILLFGIFFVVGILLSFGMDKIIAWITPNNSLYQLGLVSLLTLVLHNIPEGITTFLTTSSHFTLGLSLSCAIAIHNIPEGIAIAVPIYYSTGSRSKAFILTLISGFSEFLGALLAFLVLPSSIHPFVLAIILSMTAGIMISISFYELLPKAFSYRDGREVLFGFSLGSFIMGICIFLFHV